MFRGHSGSVTTALGYVNSADRARGVFLPTANNQVYFFLIDFMLSYSLPFTLYKLKVQ